MPVCSIGCAMFDITCAIAHAAAQNSVLGTCSAGMYSGPVFLRMVWRGSYSAQEANRSLGESAPASNSVER